MARGYHKIIAIRDSGEVEKYIAQSISDVVNEKDDSYNPFVHITEIGLVYSREMESDEYEVLDWHD